MNKFVMVLVVFNVLLGLAGCTNLISTETPAPAPTASSSSPTSSSFVLTSSESSVQGADNPLVPGATGRTIVPGNNSTIAGNQLATWQQRTGTP